MIHATSFGPQSECSKECRFFGKCTAPLADASWQTKPVVHFQRGETIYSKGDEAHYCYKVLEGAVRISSILADGHRQVLSFSLPNETFGIETSKHYSATADAVGDVAALRCPRACIENLNSERSDTMREMMSMLSHEISAAQDHLVMLGHQSARARVATFLLRLAADDETKNIALVDLPVGRQDMADYLGLTIETTCRTLTDLKTAKVIGIPNRRQIAIHNRERLEMIAEGEA